MSIKINLQKLDLFANYAYLKIRLSIVFFLSVVFISYGQEKDSIRIELTSTQDLNEFISLTEQNHPVRIFVVDTDIEGIEVMPNNQPEVLDLILEKALQNSGSTFINYRNYVYIIGPRERIARRFSSDFYNALEETINIESSEENLIETIGSLDQLDPNNTPVITGVITDAETGEAIIGGTLLVLQNQLGSATDIDGNYSLELPPGDYDIQVQYIGYLTRSFPVKVISGGTLNITLEKSAVLLDEVVVEAMAKDENVESADVGVSRLSTKEIEKIPTFLGEVDIVKGLLLQPGVSTIGEGATGFNVRGGNVDQNLVMVDEGILFNPSHALGFFSSFNPDVVNDALLYKGNAPSKYGGRLASVLNINLRDGNFDKLRLKGGVGLVSGRLTIEAPIIKNKTSFIASGRSTYSNWLLQRVPIPEVQDSRITFYDANFRLTHRFNEKSNINLSLYNSGDNFLYANQFGFTYGNTLGEISYRQIIGTKFLSTSSFVIGNYKSNQLSELGFNGADLTTGIGYNKFKENISYNSGALSMDFGLSSIFYTVNPGDIVPAGEVSVVSAIALPEEKAIESAIYAGGDYKINSRITVSAGLRYTLYMFNGPQEMYTYENSEVPRTSTITGTANFDEFIIKSYGHLQPRFSSRIRLTPSSSFKLGYARTVQYLNQISNTSTPTPTNIWQLSTQYIQPKTAHNFSLGYFNNFDNNNWITSLEVFYRNIDQLFDYKDFADLVVNDHIETELLYGIGRAAGVELSINKQLGKVNGMFNYTYSRSQLKIDGINNFQWYASNFDKPHDLSLVTNLVLNKRHQLSFNFTYSTGRPVTLPINRFRLGEHHSALNFSDRNLIRIPDYHRLDVAYTIGQGLRKSKKFKTSWTFSVYNIYGRANAFSVYLIQRGAASPTINRLSILGSAFPSVTFNFELI